GAGARGRGHLRHLRELREADPRRAPRRPPLCHTVHQLPAVAGGASLNMDARDAAIEPAPGRSVARWRAVLPVLALAVGVVVADQLTKLWIVAAIGREQPTHEIVLLPGWLSLQYVENTGAAFGLFRDGGWVLAGLAAVVVVVIVAVAPRLG